MGGLVRANGMIKRQRLILGFSLFFFFFAPWSNFLALLTTDVRYTLRSMFTLSTQRGGGCACFHFRLEFVPRWSDTMQRLSWIKKKKNSIPILRHLIWWWPEVSILSVHSIHLRRRPLFHLTPSIFYSPTPTTTGKQHQRSYILWPLCKECSPPPPRV